MKKRVRTEPPAALDLQSPEIVYSGDVAPLNMQHRTIRHFRNRKHKYRHFRSFDPHFHLPKHKTALFCSFESLLASTAAGVYDFRQLQHRSAAGSSPDDRLSSPTGCCSRPESAQIHLHCPLYSETIPLPRYSWQACFIGFVLYHRKIARGIF